MADLIPRQVLFGNPERVAPRLSPDGSRLAWIAPDNGVLNVWLAPVDKDTGVDLDAANYAHRESLFELLPKPQNRIVFAGDSLTQGGEWAEFYCGALNRGIGGDTSEGMMKRIRTITALNPRAVFLMVGSNDLYNLGLSPRQTIENTRLGIEHADVRAVELVA